MSRAFQVHWEILPEAQRRLWPELHPGIVPGFTEEAEGVQHDHT